MIVQMWEGMALQITVPMITAFPWQRSYEDFPTNCCGAGAGFWERVVPDYIHIPPIIVRGADPTAIKISPACSIHDLDWDNAAPSWDDFHAGNSRFYANIKTIVLKKTRAGSNTQLYALRYPAIYAHAVDTGGRKVFWKLKRDQGHQIPDSAAWLL